MGNIICHNLEHFHKVEIYLQVGQRVQISVTAYMQMNLLDKQDMEGADNFLIERKS